MTLNLIDKKMIVRNTIELQPTHTYVSASLESSDLESYNISEPGTYGSLSSSINKDKFYQINNSLDDPITLSKNYIVNKNLDTGLRDLNSQNSLIFKLDFVKKVISDPNLDYNQKRIDDVYLNEYLGANKNNEEGYNFGVEKIKQRFLVDDEGYYKKKSILNLYKYYQDNMQHRVINPQWGFGNYNCLNFFNISNVKNVGKTHRNCLAYPNPQINNKNVYEFFNNTDELNLSFYINQNNKNQDDYHFNPGCVLYIEGIIGIYIVKGSNVDDLGLTNQFRILVVYGDSIDKKQRIVNFLNSRIGEENDFTDSSIDDISFYLSKDNILKYNNWHNVSISIQKRRSETLPIFFFQTNIYVDSILSSQKQVELSLSDSETFSTYMKPSNKNYITIGNRFRHTDDNAIADIFKKLFSSNLSQNNDFVGPYVNKNIDFGKDIVFFEEELTDLTFGLDNDLKLSTDDYFGYTNSFSLSAELHDVRIYNKVITDIDYLICKNSIKDFADENLIFSIPVLYYDNRIKKKSIINLSGISENNNITDISTTDVVLDGPINHCFSNKTLGHEVNVEKFVYEFKRKVCPNVIFNNDIDANLSSYNCLNVLSYDNGLENSSSLTNSLIRKGISINEAYNKVLIEKSKEENLLPVTDFYFENYFSYINNFILPCDNGLQSQIRRSVMGYYDDLTLRSGHLDSSKNNNLDNIDIRKIFNIETVFLSNNLLTEIGNAQLYDFTQSLNELMPYNQREDYYVIDGLTNNVKFKVSYDNFKNISLNNFYREDFILKDTVSGKFLKYSSNQLGVGNIKTIGRGSYLKDLSNPVCRKVNDNYQNSIANHLSSIDEKVISNDSNNRKLYYKTELPFYNLNNDYLESYSNIFCISNQLFGRRLERETIEIFDADLGGTFGSKKIKLKDNGKGVMYRADSYTKHAEWNYVGNCLYKEGIITVLHPSLENFGENGYKLDFKSSSKLNVLELNLPAYAGKTNKSNNLSKIEDLRLNESAFNSDEDFVYITDMNLHDSNLNIIGKAKIINPYSKKDSDNVLFRLKMDY